MINKRKLIALCTSRVYDPLVHNLVVRLNNRLKSEGFSMLIFAINSDIFWEEDRPAAEKYVFDLIPYDDVECIVIMDEKIKSHNVVNRIISKANSHEVPVIVADGQYDNVSCINFDYERGFEDVVRHVIEHHKVKNPHMVAGQPGNDFSEKRIAVFKKVLSENNITFTDDMLSYGYFWANPCHEIAQELMERESLPDAIICANDIMAITICDILLEAGYKVPGDTIITGFDGYDEIYFTSPKITSSSCNVIYMADTIADTILLTSEDQKTHNIIIPPVFIPNESCGCPVYSEHRQALRDLFNESFIRHNDDNRILQQVSSAMQTSNTINELLSNIDCYKTENLLCVIDRECLDSTGNYFTRDFEPDHDRELVLIYDSDNKEQYQSNDFAIPKPSHNHKENVLSEPFRDRILELAEGEYPLIFNALDFMNRPFGFICYYYNHYFITDYSNTVNITNFISIGFGGFINLQYQLTLINKMDEMYRHDPLTTLYNRIGFQNAFRRHCRRSDLFNKKITVIMSDLDGLKFINDNFGHAEGDSAIATAASALDKSTPDSALCVRFGGDELFSVIFGECDPELIIKNIEDYLSQYNDSSGKPYKVLSSCGYISTILDYNFNITQALKEADEKMYIIKKRRKDKMSYMNM